MTISNPAKNHQQETIPTYYLLHILFYTVTDFLSTNQRILLAQTTARKITRTTPEGSRELEKVFEFKNLSPAEFLTCKFITCNADNKLRDKILDEKEIGNELERSDEKMGKKC